MKVIKDLSGYSSKVELVEIDGQQYVFKTADVEEIRNEKRFLEILRENGLPSLEIINYPGLKPNQILLEYIPDQKGQLVYGSETDYVKFGEVVRQLHSVQFEYPFRIDSEGNEIRLDWKTFLIEKVKETISEQSVKQTDVSPSYFNDIEQFVNKRITEIDFTNATYSLVHCDLHTGNTLGKSNAVILYDKGSGLFAGVSLFDLTTIIDHHPNGTFVTTDNPEFANDKKILEAFISGYGEDFIKTRRAELELYLVVRCISINPFAPFRREIIENIIYGSYF